MFVADGVEYSVSAYVWNHLRKDDQADSTSVAVNAETKLKLPSPNNLEHKPGRLIVWLLLLNARFWGSQRRAVFKWWSPSVQAS